MLSYIKQAKHISYIFVYPTSTMKTGVLWLSQDGECGNGVFKSRYIHRLNVVIGHSEHHVSARHPHPGRALPAETLQGAHQLINVGLDLRLVKGDGFISGLVG